MKPGKVLSVESLLSITVVALAFLLGLNKIHDPDAWGHLSLGRLIWDSKGIPPKEVFTYPSADMPLLYTSWLFGLISYLSYSAFGDYGPVLLKAVTVAATFFVLLKDSLSPKPNIYVAAFVLIPAALAISFRFVLRPDIFMMIFLSVTIYSLRLWYTENRKYIYALPAVHLLWANSHSSITLIFLPFGAFILGGLVQRYWDRRKPGTLQAPTLKQIGIVGLVFAASFLASLINPNTAGQYAYAGSLMASPWYKRFIFELISPDSGMRSLIFVIDGLIVASFLLNLKRLSFIDVLLVLPVLYLPFLSVRFVILPVIIGSPVVIRNISSFFADITLPSFVGKKPVKAVIAAVLMLACLFLVFEGQSVGVTQYRPGFGFDLSEMPAGTIAYMDRHGIYGRVFNSFHFGSYILWTGYPRRTVFIDSRGFLPEALLDQMTMALGSNSTLDELAETYGFEAILISHPLEEIYSGMHGFWFSHPRWALVYWDDVSLLYLKRGGKYDGLIDRDGYSAIRPDMSFYYFLQNVARGQNAGEKLGVAEELERNIRITGSSRALTFLGILYSQTDRCMDAVRTLSGITRFHDKEHAYLVSVLLGQCHEVLGDLKKTAFYYEQALGLKRDAVTLFRTGEIFLKLNDLSKARRLLLDAVEMDRNLLEAYPPLIAVSEKTGRLTEAARFREQYQALVSK